MNTYNKYLLECRKKDISTRGKDTLVIDYNNDVVTLEQSLLWCDINGNYVFPNDYICDVCNEIIKCSIM